MPPPSIPLPLLSPTSHDDVVTLQSDDAAPAASADIGVKPGRRVYLETFGCQMNVLDSELMQSQLAADGYTFTDDWKQADVVLYNTCSVRDHAEQKVRSRIGQVTRHKRDTRPDVVLGVVGCMAQRDGQGLLRRHQAIDLLCALRSSTNCPR